MVAQYSCSHHIVLYNVLRWLDVTWHNANEQNWILRTASQKTHLKSKCSHCSVWHLISMNLTLFEQILVHCTCLGTKSDYVKVKTEAVIELFFLNSGAFNEHTLSVTLGQTSRECERNQWKVVVKSVLTILHLNHHWAVTAWSVSKSHRSASLQLYEQSVTKNYLYRSAD